MNLNQVTVPSSDVARSIRFYRLLGLTLIVESLPRYARFECPAGDSTFSVELKPSASPSAAPSAAASGPPSGIVIYFEVHDLPATVASLQSRGIVFDTQPKDQPWLWREATLRDPDGNTLCLFTAGPNRRYPPWRLPA